MNNFSFEGLLQTLLRITYELLTKGHQEILAIIIIIIKYQNKMGVLFSALFKVNLPDLQSKDDGVRGETKASS